MIVYPTWRESYPEPVNEEIKRKVIVSSSGKKENKLIYDKNGPIPFPKDLFKSISSNKYKSIATFSKDDLAQVINKFSNFVKDYEISKNKDFTIIQPNLFQENPKTNYVIGSPINSNLQIYKTIIVDGKVDNPLLEAVHYADEQLKEVMYSQHHVAILYTTLTSNLESTIQKVPSSTQEYSKYQAFSLLGLTQEQYIDIEYMNIEVGQQTSTITIQKITPF